MNQTNFEELDKKIIFKYKTDLYVLVKKAGYTYVSECVYDLYFNKNKPVSYISKKIERTRSHVCYLMKKWDFKRRSKGGNTKNTRLSDPEFRNKIFSMKGKKTTTAVAKEINCSVSWVSQFWRGAA